MDFLFFLSGRHREIWYIHSFNSYFLKLNSRVSLKVTLWFIVSNQPILEMETFGRDCNCLHDLWNLEFYSCWKVTTTNVFLAKRDDFGRLIWDAAEGHWRLCHKGGRFQDWELLNSGRNREHTAMAIRTFCRCPLPDKSQKCFLLVF